MRSRLARSLIGLATASELMSAEWYPLLLDVTSAAEGDTPVLPGLFAAYHDLISLIRVERFDEAETVLEEIARGVWQTTPLTVRDLNPESFPGHTYERYHKYLAVDPTTPLSMTAPDEASSATMRQRVSVALDLLAMAHPDLAAEVRQIVSEIVLARTDGSNKEQDFAGASSFAVWGAIFLNTDEHDDVAELTQALAHEAAHLLLFAEAIDGPLVENPESERFLSPLRSDPRPMDGIFHATFVTARMHLAARALEQSGSLATLERARLRNVLLAHQSNFDGGIATIRQNATLTKLGNDLLSGAEEYMASARAA
jgi:HEXXH motif-containing protein